MTLSVYRQKQEYFSHFVSDDHPWFICICSTQRSVWCLYPKNICKWVQSILDRFDLLHTQSHWCWWPVSAQAPGIWSFCVLNHWITFSQYTGEVAWKCFVVFFKNYVPGSNYPNIVRFQFETLLWSVLLVLNLNNKVLDTLIQISIILKTKKKSGWPNRDIG